jgi:hypothetical protein
MASHKRLSDNSLEDLVCSECDFSDEDLNNEAVNQSCVSISDESESNLSESNSDISTSAPTGSDWKLYVCGTVFTKTEKKGTVALLKFCSVF